MAKTTDIDFLPVPEAGSPKVQVSAGLVPSEGCERESAPISPLASGSWLASWYSWLVDTAIPQSLPRRPPCVSVQFPPFQKDTTHN